MAGFRPAGFSDEDSDSDDYGFFEKPVRRFVPSQPAKNRVEVDLQDAIINGNLLEVEKIITHDLKQSVNIRLDSGWTPLMHACFHAQDIIVQYLLNQGSDPNLHADSVTPLMAACSNSSASDDVIYAIIANLIAKNCLLNIGDKYGQTPLMRAISSGRLTVVQKLLENNVNIEMRDQQGWTAAFWAVHNNQQEILNLLIAHGARLTEVDKSNRNLLEIATSHDYENIVQILNTHLKTENKTEVERDFHTTEISTWQDFYPGLEKGVKPDYRSEIPHLLYGMSCERLTPLVGITGMDLRTFLLMDEDDMIKTGVDMPYERQRLKLGLRKFHMRGWKLNAVAGLYARKSDNYSVVDCLTTLGTHLHQIYILEATLQYTMREYNKVQNQLKFEPPDSPLLTKMKKSSKNLHTHIASIRSEMKNLKRVLNKISRDNPQPADLLRQKSVQEIAISYATELIVVCSIGFIVYHAKKMVTSLIGK